MVAHLPTKKSAFTLIELLVVIVIIAILAGIAMPVFGAVQFKAKKTQEMNNLRNIGTAIVAYSNDHEDTFIPITGGKWVYNSGAQATLFKELGQSYKIMQSPMDPRKSVDGATAHISYSPNPNLIVSETWNGMLSTVDSPSTTVMFSANFTGRPDVIASWGGNNATSASVLVEKGPGIDAKGLGDRTMCVVFTDTSVRSVKLADYRNTGAASGDWVKWKPKNETATP